MINSNFIIFLDIDGVLCSYDENIYARDFDENHEHNFKLNSISALNNIINYYNADLCMISSWNSKFSDENKYQEFLKSRGIKVNNLFVGNHHNRSEFIIEQINMGLKYYLIIDDEAYQYFNNMNIIEYKRILRTDRNRCLDDYDFKHVTRNWKLNI